MNKKFAQAIWLVIIILFIGMKIYHVIVGNYDDVAISMLTVITLLSMFAVYCLIKTQNKK